VVAEAVKVEKKKRDKEASEAATKAEKEKKDKELADAKA
jgi:hypothetical protein